MRRDPPAIPTCRDTDFIGTASCALGRALIQDRSVDEAPHLIVGIEAEGDFENVVREAGTVAADTAPKGEPIDLVRVTRGESGLRRYLGFLREVIAFANNAILIRWRII